MHKMNIDEINTWQSVFESSIFSIRVSVKNPIVKNSAGNYVEAEGTFLCTVNGGDIQLCSGIADIDEQFIIEYDSLYAEVN